MPLVLFRLLLGGLGIMWTIYSTLFTREVAEAMTGVLSEGDEAKQLVIYLS